MPGRNEGAIPPARPVIGEAEIEAAVRVLRSGMVVQGPEVAAFEEEFSELVDGRHCVAVNSGTSALHLALLALGIGPGDEVIVPSFSFAATRQRGPAGRRRAGLRRHRAGQLLPRPGRGRGRDRPAHRGDHAGAPVRPPGRDGPDHGARRAARPGRRRGRLPRRTAPRCDGSPVGAFGTAGCFSFYPTKNMHSLEGGMITTADAELARTLRLLRNQGMEQRYANEIVGANMRLTDVAAAIGRVQLTPAAGWTEQRRANAKFLDSADHRRWSRRRSPTAPGTSTTSTRSGCPGDRDAAQAHADRARASAARSTTRRRSTGSGRT